jgi:FlaG/FlaF family flagellin (archaellin)
MLPRKTRFRRCSKGVSTVIGIIFLVLIALTVATNVFLWTFTQNAAYNQAVKESSQMDADRSSERIDAYYTVYSVYPVSPDKVNVTTTMTAQGALSAQIITVWVTWTDGNDIKYGSETVNINVTSGDTITPPPITVTMSGALAGDGEFNGWLVTARGNRVPLEEKRVEEIVVSDVALGIGAISMDFSNFKYYNVTENGGLYVLHNYTNGGDEGYRVIQGGDGVAFKICLTNYDIDNRSITLYSPSVLWTLFPNPKNPLQARGSMWYIVNVNASGFIADDFTNITINYGDSRDLFFAAELDVNEDVFKPHLSSFLGLAPVNLALYGTIGGESYGQNIPFVSIYIENG